MFSIIVTIVKATALLGCVRAYIMDRIETPSYLAGRLAFREYLDSNPWIAKRKKINTFFFLLDE